MTSWADVESVAPELAHAVRTTFSMGKHATMATIDGSGAPRISGTEVIFKDGDIYVAMMSGTRRAADLRREPRIAIHCPTDDPPADDPASWLGDGKVNARAIEVEPDKFRLDIEQVVLTKVAPGGKELQITSWRPGSDVAIVRRG